MDAQIGAFHIEALELPEHDLELHVDRPASFVGRGAIVVEPDAPAAIDSPEITIHPASVRKTGQLAAADVVDGVTVLVRQVAIGRRRGASKQSHDHVAS